MVKGLQDPIDTILQITQDLEGLSTILEENYPLVSRAMKTRFTKLKRKIAAHLQKNHPDPLSTENPNEKPMRTDSEDELTDSDSTTV